jgi:cytochrome c oxidase cbb3-type subunit 3
MSGFWSGWVMALTVLNLAIVLFMLVWGQRVKLPTEPDGTTGHVWAHGVLREAVRKLPTWWVVLSVSLFVWGLVFLVMYPGFGGYKGVLGWTSAGQLERDTAANDARLETTLARVRGAPIEQLASDDVVTRYGRVLFEDNCAACHGRDGRGNLVLGAPSLVDTDWMYGGDGAAILKSILDGRSGVMPALGGTLGQQGVNEVASYVLTMNGYQAPEDWVAAGKTRFETLCVACHGVDARGNPALGAPNLTDNVWLYGRDFEQIADTVSNGRTGVMPAWRVRLGGDQARAVAAFVYANAHRPQVAAK